MLALGQDGSGRVIGAHIIIFLVSSVTYMGAMLTPEKMGLSLLSLDVGAPIITLPSGLYSSSLLCMPTPCSLSYSPFVPYSTSFLHSQTSPAFPIVVIIVLWVVVIVVIDICSRTHCACRWTSIFDCLLCSWSLMCVHLLYASD